MGEVRGRPQQGTPSSHGGGRWLCTGESPSAWRGRCVSRGCRALTRSGRAKGTQPSLWLQRREGRKGKETARTSIFLEKESGKVNSDTHTKKKI